MVGRRFQVGEAVYCALRQEHTQAVFLGYSSRDPSVAYVLDIEALVCMSAVPTISVETVDSDEVHPLLSTGLTTQFRDAYFSALRSTSNVLRRTLENHRQMAGQPHVSLPA